MPNDVMPLWFSKLENEDVEFIKKFILASGSLKEMARQYGVTYPTVRLRLDKLIQKIKVNEDLENEPYVSLIKRMVIDEKIDYDVAKILIEEYRKNISGKGERMKFLMGFIIVAVIVIAVVMIALFKLFGKK